MQKVTADKIYGLMKMAEAFGCFDRIIQIKSVAMEKPRGVVLGKDVKPMQAIDG